MSARHRTKADSIFVIRTWTIEKKKDLRRDPTKMFTKKDLKFPNFNKNVRAPSARFKKVFYARRPKFFRG